MLYLFLIFIILKYLSLFTVNWVIGACIFYLLYLAEKRFMIDSIVNEIINQLYFAVKEIDKQIIEKTKKENYKLNLNNRN